MKNSSGIRSQLMMFLAWCGLTLLAAHIYHRWLLEQYNPNITPTFHQYRSGTKEVVLERNHYGHYISSGSINNINVVFLLDTGSTQVAIPGHIAQTLNLDFGEKQATGTANGTIWVYNTILETLKIGNIEMHNVSASINPHMEESEVLLGMSALKHLDFSQRGNLLTLHQN
ncbi:MAG: TIGR02281 family clan AA aspartic protease [Gammaproteobacteria bacterium]